MLDSESGEAIFSRIVAYQMDAVIDGDTITTSLVAACYSDALRKGEPPRQVARDLLEALPDDYDWEMGLRETFQQALDQFEERAA